MTPKQLEVLRFIETYQTRTGCAPTLREIAEHLRVSKVTILSHLRNLERGRHIKRSRYGRRAIQVLTRSRRIPVLGRIAAGRPIEAVEADEGTDILQLLGGPDTFALQIRGDSMTGDNLSDGDFVIVERRSTVRDGEIVVALLDSGEATIKRFYRENGRVRLQPSNPAMEPLYVTHVAVQGVVVGIYRRL
jgi:repressor LexA